jgi:hypothetical protein
MPWPARDSGFQVKETPGVYSWNKPNLAKRMWYRLTGQADMKRLELMARQTLERYMFQCWIQDDADGFTGWRWDKYKVDFVIVSAANRYKDIVVMGPRHYSNLMMAHIEAYGGVDLLRKYAGDDLEQGFVDQYGTFYDRVTAKKIAIKRGQLRYPQNCPGSDLFSEGIC